ncbi:hypothetical protein [Frigoribacterium sp. VKM Ac-2530]|uniref:hypothetical protein n=1 Tax=Frigoribacterium sp. VKM Ac-2530 TaxID=2783822 RepID=UPI00188C6A50|nr:hypothetical protein [Frigoribacterium sp. VKM Ac-2530]MBF4580062.1 hypothetical protein [Frigoribacterium sp. VKM Ac-2530]
MTRSSAVPAVPSSAASGSGASGRGVRVARAVLVVVGVALIGLGGWVLTETVSPTRYGGLLVWLIGAVIAHDAIIAPVVAGIALVVGRTGRRITPAVLAIVQVGIVLGVVLTLVVVPEIIAKARGPKNDTVLPFDYGVRLGVAWLVVVVLTALAVVAWTVLARRREARRAA